MQEQVGFCAEAEEGGRRECGSGGRKGKPKRRHSGVGGGNKEDPIGREEASEAEHEREVPRRSGTRAGQEKCQSGSNQR